MRRYLIASSLGGELVLDIDELTVKGVNTLYDMVEKEGIGQFLSGQNRLEYNQYQVESNNNGTIPLTYPEWLAERKKAAVDIDTNTDFESAKNFVPPPPRRYDPLTLDLDNDGVETIGIDGSVVFDHDADGLKQGTGWIAPDDGLLVLDRDGNGTIDSGRELFGDNTLKSDGTLAIDGLDALADLDSNGDGEISSEDAAFSELRVWRDINTDGLSQADELFSLEELDIVSINTQGVTVNEDQGNGNLISKVTTFVKSDGSVGSSGSVSQVEQAAVDVDLATDPFFREFTDTVSLTEEISVLPDMKGSGAVRDLREAAQLNANLAAELDSYSNLSSMAEQQAAIHDLLQKWADSADFDDFVERINKTTIGGTVQLQFALRAEVGLNGVGDGSTNTVPSMGINDAVDSSDSTELEKAISKIRILEAFTGKVFFDFSDTSSDSGSSMNVVIGNRAVSRNFASGLATTYTITADDLGLEQQRIDFINQSYDSLVQSVYEALLPQTIFADYLNAISLEVESGQLVLDFSGFESVVKADFENQPLNTVHNILELARINENLSQMSSSWNPYTFLYVMLQENGDIAPDVQILLDEYQVQFVSDGAMDINSESSLIIVGNELNNTLIGNSSDNKILGYKGDDILNAGYGNDTLLGGAGDDILLVAHTGNNTLDGGDGSDTITVNRANTYRSYNGRDAANHSNTLIGGRGDDRLEGWTGADTYIFNRGDGSDTINDHDLGYSYKYNISYNRADKIEFGAGITQSELWFDRTNDNLVISTVGTDDSVTIENWYTSSRYQIESIEVEDYSLSNNQVDALVQAMAVFDAPSGAGEEIPQHVKDQLQPVLASSWQPTS